MRFYIWCPKYRKGKWKCKSGVNSNQSSGQQEKQASRRRVYLTVSAKKELPFKTHTQISRTETNTLALKLTNSLIRYFSKEDKWMTKRLVKRLLNIFGHQTNTNGHQEFQNELKIINVLPSTFSDTKTVSFHKISKKNSEKF